MGDGNDQSASTVNTDATSSTGAQAMSFTMEQLNTIIQSAITGALAAQVNTGSQSTHQARRPEPPSISLDCNEGRWSFFTNEWKMYKTQAKLPENAPAELRNCCSEDLRFTLFELLGPSIDDLNEKDLMEKIHKVAVKGKKIAVHRQEFYNMKQEEGQSAQQFLAKLRAKADHCNFQLTCSSEDCSHTSNSYAPAMVADVLTVGCYDQDIQGELLARSADVQSLQDKFELMQAMESGKRARNQLTVQSSVTVQRSAHRQSRQQNASQTITSPTGCEGCSSTEHGPGTNKPRKKHCPAWSVSCEFCHIMGHFAKVCRKKRENNTSQTRSNDPTTTGKNGKTTLSSHIATSLHTQGTAITDTTSSWLATMTDDEKQFTTSLHTANSSAWSNSDRPQPHGSNLHHKILIPNMEWDHAKDRFTEQRPKPLPTLRVQITPLPSAHNSFHCSLPRSSKPGQLTAVADTGAQTCHSGPAILEHLGIERRHLVPTSHRIQGVTQSNLNIWGVLLAKITVGNVSTNQVIYICENARGLYLSESALRGLGCISPSFPKNSASSCSTLSSSQEKCSCPRRSPTPKRPSQIPVTPSEVNVKKLEEWILEYYKSSAFNTCEHQPLPQMTADPITIHFQPNVSPSAHHCPIPVPHHWKGKVKADLDRDVRLGIIEPVPPDTPTIWCSRMVVVAKKDGSPRRTIDLQCLNEATYRATHHTSSPFNLASSITPNTRKTILDSWNAYHLLPLSEEARDATTFITEWGRYRYLRGPQGFKASGDAYAKAYYDLTMDIPRKVQCVDDTLLWDNDIEESFWHTIDYITHCFKMELSSTQQNSDSARQRSTLQASMSPKMALNLPNPSSMPSPLFPSPPTSEMLAHGLA